LWSNAAECFLFLFLLTLSRQKFPAAGSVVTYGVVGTFVVVSVHALNVASSAFWSVPHESSFSSDLIRFSVASRESFGKLGLTSVTVVWMVVTSNAVLLDVAWRFLAFHVLLDFQWVLSVIEDPVSAVDDELTVPWAESFVAHDHTHGIAVAGLSADKSASFDFVSSWFEFA
jgi:hypothetical protein